MTIDLGPLYEPSAVRFSFDTPGWYLLGGLLLLFAVLFFLKWLKHYRKNRYRREAMRVLTEIELQIKNQEGTHQINDILVLLKLVAIKAFGRQEVAQLHGNEWLEFLESKGIHTPFTQYKKNILNSLYVAIAVDIKETKELIELSKQWIRTHA